MYNVLYTELDMGHMVRVDDETHARLVELAEEERETIGRALAHAVETYRQRRFWDQFDRAARALKSDPVAWQKELGERATWDATLADGLENEPPYPLEELKSKHDAPNKRRRAKRNLAR